MPLLTSLLTGIELPFLHRVTRHIPDDGLSDIPRSGSAGRGLFLSRAWEATAGPQPKDSSACWSIWA